MLQVARGVKKMKKLNKVVAVLLMPLVMVGCGAMNKNLHLPASEGDLDKVRMEIEGGRKVDTKDAAGQTALMYAAETGRIEVIERSNSCSPAVQMSTRSVLPGKNQH
jgi:hypothetical protein